MHRIEFSGFTDCALLKSAPGSVIFNGKELKAHEALILSDMLREMASEARDKADKERQGFQRAWESHKQTRDAAMRADDAAVCEQVSREASRRHIGG